MKKPKVICLCGSTRFVETFNEYNQRLSRQGNIVLSIEIVSPQSEKAPGQTKQMLEELHLRKIDLADEILVLNVGGYIGKSTAAEISYAQKTGKPVKYLEPVENTSAPEKPVVTQKPEEKKSNDFMIRDFRIGDYEKVAALWEEAGIHYRPNGRESRTRMAQEMKNGQAIFMVAADGERITGVVLGTHDGRKGWINRLAVAKEFQRQNIALKLVTAVENRLDELGIDVLACLIEPENTASKTFFSKLGYTKAPVEYFSKKKSTDA